MHTIAALSLSGGQGKTTTTLFLSKILAGRGLRVLAIDADPQANLTTFLGQHIEPTDPTLLEFMRGTVKETADAVYPTSTPNLALIPADDGLEGLQEYLSGTGMGALLLRQRLQKLQSSFDLCLIDSPPQAYLLTKSVIGASDSIVIPCELNGKGFGSLIRSLTVLSQLQEMDATQAEVVGIMPFRDRWFGLNRSKDSQFWLNQMMDLPEVQSEWMLPTLRESVRVPEAISKQSMLAETQQLDYPFSVLSERLMAKLAVASEVVHV
jgi:chromosome partitioning protein